MYPPKLYQGPTINSWPSQPKAGYGLVMTMTTMTTMMTMMRVVRCNPSGNDSAQLIWESAQLISSPADCQLSYSTFCCIEQNYKKIYKSKFNQSSNKMRQKRFLPNMFISKVVESMALDDNSKSPEIFKEILT